MAAAGVSGDKSVDFPHQPLEAFFPGYALFWINYRLATYTNNQFPAQEDDVKSAIEFIYNNRGKYQISDQVVLFGISAGGHLALLQAYKYASNIKVQAVVAYVPITDLVALYNNPPSATTFDAINEAIGATPSSNPQIYQQSSPVNYVTAQSCPTMLFIGGLDTLVQPSQSYSLDSILQNKNVPSPLTLYPYDGHGFTTDDYIDSYFKAGAFLNQYVH